VFTSRAARAARPCPLAVFARDGGGTVVGGVHGWMWGGRYELVSLWVDEPLRNRGLGSSLLTEAEGAAQLRGCRQVVVLTHHVQAPDLYRRAGYSLVGKVTDHPASGAAYWFRKRLDRRPDAVVRRLVHGVVWATLGLVALREAAAIIRRRDHR
jgi:ribosomal protein S18 acetylase RimI-like enzyme